MPIVAEGYGGVVSVSFEKTGFVQRECTVSPFLFGFVFNRVLEDSLDTQEVGVQLENETSCVLNNTGDLVCLFESVEHARHATKCKCLATGLDVSTSKLLPDSEELTTIGRFNYSVNF